MPDITENTILDTMITDRTQEDVNRVDELVAKGYQSFTDEEKTEWATDMKGALNASDINRVIQATNYLAEHIKQYNYYARLQDIKQTWVVNDMPLKSELDTYVYNARQVLAYGNLLDIPQNSSRLDYIGQNNIEKFMQRTPQFLGDAEKVKIHVGTCFAGFQGGLRR